LEAVTGHLKEKPEPSDIWVVGDTPHDVSCGRAIGANVLAVATGWHTLAELQACDADATFADLSEVSRVLELFGVR
jgi:phosphoglycolate phosphatase